MSREVFQDGSCFIERPCHWCDGYCNGECWSVECDRCGERFDRDLGAEFDEGTACPDCFAQLAEIAEAS